MSDDTEVMALSGLRRLVTHARDGLKATEIEPPAQFGYGKEWSPAQIRRYAAHTLAEQEYSRSYWTVCPAVTP
jgi:hypothetical protein